MRLINGDKLLEVIAEQERWNVPDFVYESIKNAPTIDAEPIKIGHWIEKGIGIAECDVCNRQNLYRQDGKGIVTKYCPYCGARMEW